MKKKNENIDYFFFFQKAIYPLIYKKPLLWEKKNKKEIFLLASKEPWFFPLEEKKIYENFEKRSWSLLFSVCWFCFGCCSLFHFWVVNTPKCQKSASAAQSFLVRSNWSQQHVESTSSSRHVCSAIPLSTVTTERRKRCGSTWEGQWWAGNQLEFCTVLSQSKQSCEGWAWVLLFAPVPALVPLLGGLGWSQAEYEQQNKSQSLFQERRRTGLVSKRKNQK